MEFHIKLSDYKPDVGVIENAILTVDPSAVVDFDSATSNLRVATSVDARQLVALLGQSGYAVVPQQVTQIPSICCGGCSG